MKELRIKDIYGETLLLMKVNVEGESIIKTFMLPTKTPISEVSLLNEDEGRIRESLATHK